MRVEPALLLLGRAADGDRIAAEEGGEQARRDADVDARHGLADAVDVEGTAAHPAVLLGDEHELHSKLVSHLTNQRLRELVFRVELEEERVGELRAREVLN